MEVSRERASGVGRVCPRLLPLDDAVFEAGENAVGLAGVGCFFMGLASAFKWFGCGCSHRHALALAHASGGSKCKGRIPSPKGAGGGLHKRSAEDEGAPCRRVPVEP